MNRNADWVSAEPTQHSSPALGRARTKLISGSKSYTIALAVRKFFDDIHCSLFFKNV